MTVPKLARGRAILTGALLGCVLVVAGSIPAAHASTSSASASAREVSLTMKISPPAVSPAALATPAIRASGGTDGCEIDVEIRANSSQTAITGTALTEDCTGVVDCTQSVDLQLLNPRESADGWSTTRSGPIEHGCTSADASIVSKACNNSNQGWDYRSQGVFTIDFQNGDKFGPKNEETATISLDKLC
jgi:hypothetical protein